VIFLPDRFLGAYVASMTDVELVLWDGSCMVHDRFSGDEIRHHRAGLGEIAVIAHPECPPDVLAEADYVGSTSGIIDWVHSNRPDRVMMITECSMADNVALEAPDVEFVRPCNLCPHMKRITLDGIRHSLETMTHQVEVPDDVAVRARRAVDRMLEIGRREQ
jgi:quinolinate synthase